MNTWKQVLAPVLVFVLGSVVGGGVVAIYTIEKFARLAERSPAETSEIGARTLARRLELDAEQRAAARPILFDTARELARIRADTMPEVRATINSAAERLRPILRPDQQQKLNEMLERPRARWNRAAPERERPPERTTPVTPP